MTSYPAVPDGARFTYLAEGAANIVYRLSLRYPTPEPSMLESYGEGTPPPTEMDERSAEYLDTVAKLNFFDFKLLRLRKELPTTLPVFINQYDWERVIKPFFAPDQIVQQELVRLRPARVIEQLNEELRQREAPNQASPTLGYARPTKREGTYLADDEYGLVITNMTPDLGGEIIEFKPKWLAQSPSAPARAIRCRQCAYVARENAWRETKGQPLLKSFCPLDLTTPDEAVRVATILLHPEPVPAKVYRFANWIRSTPLLRRLRDVQLQLDSTGVLQGNAMDENLRAAMTLRDCTVFVRFPDDGNDDKIEARLGDLDVKSPTKMDYWQDTETRLIRGGWYMGKERYQDRQPLTCQLSRAYVPARAERPAEPGYV